MSPRTIALGSALLFGAFAQSSAHAQMVVTCEFILAPRAILTSTALVASKPSEDGTAAASVLRSPSSVLRAPSSDLGFSSRALRPSGTIALSAGTFEKKPLTDPGIFPLDAAASPPSTLGQRVNEAMSSLFHVEAGAVGISILNTTGLPSLPAMSYDDR